MPTIIFIALGPLRLVLSEQLFITEQCHVMVQGL